MDGKGQVVRNSEIQDTELGKPQLHFGEDKVQAR